MSLVKEVKILCDIYEVIKLRKFEGKTSSFYKSPTWLTDSTTKFFIRANTAPFSTVEMKSLSESTGVKLTPGLTRSFITTWAKSHLNKFIRDSENAALQHSDRVIHHYQLNKQLAPQTFVATYAHEENLFPSKVGEKVADAAESVESILKAREEEQKKARKQQLLDKKRDHEKKKEERKPLGKHHIVKTKTRDRLEEILQEEFGQDLEYVVKGGKSKEWKNKVVRIIYDPYSENGEELRSLWLDMYLGDLCYGVRNYRKMCLEKGNYSRSGKSRNSFLAAALKSSIESHLKRQKRLSELKL